jgi:hypothetical protein
LHTYVLTHRHIFTCDSDKLSLVARTIEGGTSNSQTMKLFREEMGLGSAANALLQGTFQTEYEVGPAVTAWINAVRQTDKEKLIPPVIGSLSTTKFQDMFKKKHEATSSDPNGMNYTIWKAMAKSKHLSSFLSILISLPFIYGFANTRWMNMIDVMVEKKPGVQHIHMLRIIGLVCPEFNTALSYFLGHKGQQNFENTSPTDEILPCHRNNHITSPHQSPHHIPTNRTRRVDAQAH